jgi:methionine-rich copper-binding protein CopC
MQTLQSRILMEPAMRTITLAVSLLFAAPGISGAHAHAFLDHASPRVGGMVPTAPHELTLWFTQNLEGDFSTIHVTGPNGAQVEHGKPQITAKTMRVPIKPAGPGTYHVHWQALSVDTLKTRGSFTFHVGRR